MDIWFDTKEIEREEEGLTRIWVGLDVLIVACRLCINVCKCLCCSAAFSISFSDFPTPSRHPTLHVYDNEDTRRDAVPEHKSPYPCNDDEPIVRNSFLLLFDLGRFVIPGDLTAHQAREGPGI